MAHEPATIDGLLSWLPALALSPLLFAQGIYVRRVTPRLPEAPGNRSGVSGVGPALSLLILGDSAAAGVGAALQATAMAGCLVDELMADFTVSWQLHAESGVTTRDLITRLEGVVGGRYDVAIVSIGVNDVITGRRTRQWTAALASLLDQVESDFGVRHVLLSALPPMHRFTALPQPLRWCVGLRPELQRRAPALCRPRRALRRRLPELSPGSVLPRGGRLPSGRAGLPPLGRRNRRQRPAIDLLRSRRGSPGLTGPGGRQRRRSCVRPVSPA